jgi:hypothetical protein
MTPILAGGNQDPARAKEFYAKLFDWKIEAASGMDYTMIGVGDGTGGGLVKHPIPGPPSHWLAYVLVDDVAASTARAKELGGTVLQEPTEVSSYGWLSVIVDRPARPSGSGSRRRDSIGPDGSRPGSPRAERGAGGTGRAVRRRSGAQR